MSDDLPKVSIVLPTHNGAKYIKQSIDSCLSQTHQNIELVIVDDASTDSTSELIGGYLDERIKCFRHENNLGLPHALNTGFAQATGQYLTWTSDDNYYSENAIEKELRFLRDNHCEFVFCDFYRFSDDNPSELNLVKLLDALNLEKGNGVGACMLFSRKVMETVGDFDPELELAEDYDYWIRVSKKFSMHHLAEPLYYYRSHVTSLSLRRFHEVRIAEILLKSKNKFAYDFSLTNLVELCAQKYPKHLGINSIAQRLIKRKIRRKLLDLEAGKISFKKAKLALQSIVEKQ